MKSIFTLLLGTFTLISFGQDPLTINIEIVSKAYCRTAGFQNGFGVISGSAIGGSPDYIYQWKELATGITSSYSTWGGRNPGYYEFMVTDDIGTIVRDTIYLDSLNPLTSMNIISDDLSPIPDGYIGFAPAEVTFEITSEHVTIPFAEFGEAQHWLKPINYEGWTILSGDTPSFTYNYLYGGVHTAFLISRNKNGCADTTAVTIGLFGELSLGEESPLGSFNLSTNSAQIVVKKTGFQNGLRFNLYNLSGKQVGAYTITDSETYVAKPSINGLYIYELIDISTGTSVHSGKLNF